MTFHTTPVASRAYPCDRKRGCVIEPGDRYVREAVPPWTLVWDDPDGPPVQLGEWWVQRFHGACDDEWRYA